MKCSATNEPKSIRVPVQTTSSPKTILPITRQSIVPTIKANEIIDYIKAIKSKGLDKSISLITAQGLDVYRVDISRGRTESISQYTISNRSVNEDILLEGDTDESPPATYLAELYQDGDWLDAETTYHIISRRHNISHNHVQLAMLEWASAIYGHMHGGGVPPNAKDLFLGRVFPEKPKGAFVTLLHILLKEKIEANDLKLEPRTNAVIDRLYAAYIRYGGI